MAPLRRQLSLFLSTDQDTIEYIRTVFNPEQYRLIPAHVTVCREDELASIEKVIANMESIHLPQPLCIRFGKPIRFWEGKGVLIPGAGENKQFQDLRKSILQGIIDHPRLHQPHITLMHPRNSTCSDEFFARISQLLLPTELYFTTICLIEQRADEKWMILDQFTLTECTQTNL